MKTTLNKIREHEPCKSGWEKLLTYLGKTKSDDEPLSLLTILDSNGLNDAIWCLRAVEGHDKEIRLYAVWCARQVQHLMKDQRSIDALDVAERYANGEATDDELATAEAAAWSAEAAAWGVRVAQSAAWWAVRAARAAWAARVVWYGAAWAAAEAAALAAACAADDAAREKQEAELRRICEGE